MTYTTNGKGTEPRAHTKSGVPVSIPTVARYLRILRTVWGKPPQTVLRLASQLLFLLQGLWTQRK